MAAKIGHKAPVFKLVDTDRNIIALDDFAGKNVVILFFPAAFTGVCTKEMCRTRDELSDYNNMNAQVVGISVDLPFTLAKFREINKITFPLLSDFNKQAGKQYGVLYDEWILGLKGVAKRSTFVVDKTGILRHAEILEDAGNFPDFDAVKNCLAGLG
ncbi:MAG: redoxin domain-containing protein [Bacteroidetes bacterium]|nr:redoxin domain-containing protein [Bacteroidota bacterium]